MLRKKENKSIQTKISLTFISIIACLLSCICLINPNVWATENTQVQENENTQTKKMQ